MAANSIKDMGKELTEELAVATTDYLKDEYITEDRVREATKTVLGRIGGSS